MSGVIKQRSNSHAHASISDLKKFIKETESCLFPKGARRACAAFRGRMEKVLDAEGFHIE